MTFQIQNSWLVYLKRVFKFIKSIASVKDLNLYLGIIMICKGISDYNGIVLGLKDKLAL